MKKLKIVLKRYLLLIIISGIFIFLIIIFWDWIKENNNILNIFVLFLTFVAISWYSVVTHLLRKEYKKTNELMQEANRPRIIPFIPMEEYEEDQFKLKNVSKGFAKNIDIIFISGESDRYSECFNSSQYKKDFEKDLKDLSRLVKRVETEERVEKNLIRYIKIFFNLKKCFQRANLGPDDNTEIQFQCQEEECSILSGKDKIDVNNVFGKIFNFMITKQVHFRYKILIKYNSQFRETWERNTDYSNGFKLIKEEYGPDCRNQSKN